MGIKLDRKKPKNILLSIIYRLSKILLINNARKLRLYLDLEWIFDRLAHEVSFKTYNENEHPVRVYSRKFILGFITDKHVVLDIGCKYGDISYYIAQKAKKVIGIDLNEDSIEIAKAKYKKENLSFEVYEASQYLSDNIDEFDVLILSHVIEHLDNPVDFLNSFLKYFKFIYIEVPDFDRHYLNHYRKDNRIKLIYSDNDHIYEFNRYEMIALLQECNLTIIKSEYIFGVQKIWCKI